jgi:hypothetical protein
MSGSFYSKFVFPYLCELTMSGKSLSGFRQDALQEINGEVLEIGFGTGLNLPHFPETVQKIDAVDVTAECTVWHGNGLISPELQ